MTEEKKTGLLKAKAVKDSVISKVRDLGEGQQGLLVEKTSYETSPSFSYHNGLVMSIVQLYVRNGSNRQMVFTDLLEVIPSNPREGVKIFFIEKDGVIKDNEKKALAKKNAGDSRTVIEQEDSFNAKKSTRHKKDASESDQDKSDIEDYYTYELTLNTAEPIVYFTNLLAIVGPDQDSVEEQIRDLNAFLDKRHEGMRWDSVAGDQRDRLQRLFTRLEKETNGSVDTSTAHNYAGINFAASPGLCDAKGAVIGDDVLSLTGSSAVYDFEESTKDIAVIAIPSTEVMRHYEPDGANHVPVASIIAQACANDIVLNGHRAAHLVLNGFDYMDERQGYLRPVTQGAFRQYDVNRMTINPMQGFGSINEITAIYSRLVTKITNIFDILNNMFFERNEDQGLNYRAAVQKAVNSFYVNHGLWVANAQTSPLRTNIINVQHPEAYPTMAVLVQELTTMEDAARAQGSVAQADRAAALHAILTNSITEAMDVLGCTTSIEESNALQTYYNFKNVSSVKMKQVQFVNILDYVLYTLKKDDVLVIHGANHLYKTVLGAMSVETLKAAQRRGVRVVMTFDTITSPENNLEYDGLNMSDMFSIRGSYYTDFDSDVSWSLVGAMLQDELHKYARIMNNAELSDQIVQQAAVRGACQALLHRNFGRVNNFIKLSTVI